MGKLRLLILASCLVCFSLAVNVKGQSSTTLQLGTPVESSLGPGEVHTFTLNLEENNFVQIVVEQRGIDVIVKVFSPSGKSLGEYDSPNGNQGPEHLSFIAATAGSYRVTVAPLDPADTTTGKYLLNILELRQANEQEIKANKNLEGVTYSAGHYCMLRVAIGLAAQSRIVEPHSAKLRARYLNAAKRALAKALGIYRNAGGRDAYYKTKLKLLARGWDNARIGESLYLSRGTVKHHISSILGKLQVENRIQAAVQAARSGLLDGR